MSPLTESQPQKLPQSNPSVTGGERRVAMQSLSLREVERRSNLVVPRMRLLRFVRNDRAFGVRVGTPVSHPRLTGYAPNRMLAFLWDEWGHPPGLARATVL